MTKSSTTEGERRDESPKKRAKIMPVRLGMSSYELIRWRKPFKRYCCIFGDRDHREHFCPYNYIYGRCEYDLCNGECTPGPGEHKITLRSHRNSLRHFVRVNNLPPGFNPFDVEDLFTPFGPLLVWDVPWFRNGICGCVSNTGMSFGVVVFEKCADGKRAIKKLNGYKVGDHKLRVDWAYPSCV